jgi:hypothetical protein
MPRGLADDERYDVDVGYVDPWDPPDEPEPPERPSVAELRLDEVEHARRQRGWPAA